MLCYVTHHLLTYFQFYIILYTLYSFICVAKLTCNENFNKSSVNIRNNMNLWIIYLTKVITHPNSLLLHTYTVWLSIESYPYFVLLYIFTNWSLMHLRKTFNNNPESWKKDYADTVHWCNLSNVNHVIFQCVKNMVSCILIMLFWYCY